MDLIKNWDQKNIFNNSRVFEGFRFKYVENSNGTILSTVEVHWGNPLFFLESKDVTAFSNESDFIEIEKIDPIYVKNVGLRLDLETLKVNEHSASNYSLIDDVANFDSGNFRKTSYNWKKDTETMKATSFYKLLASDLILIIRIFHNIQFVTGNDWPENQNEIISLINSISFSNE